MAVWYDNQNMGSAFPLMDYGANRLANYVNQNLGNNRNTNRYSGLAFGQQLFPEEQVDETVTDINYPNLGSPLYPRTTQPRVPDWISSPNRPAPPERTGIMGNIWQGTKDLASNISPVGIINALTRRKGATESFGGYPGGFGSRAGLFPQEVSNLRQAASVNALGSQGQDVFGTNIVSQFGNYNQAMADDLANFKAKLEDESYLSRFANPDQIKTLEDLEEAMKIKYGDRTRIADKLNYLRNWNNQGTAADKITSDPTGIDISQTEIIDRPVNTGVTTTGGGGRHDYGRDRGGGYTLGGGFADQRSGARGTTTSRGDVRGHHSRAEGGRIGYQEGELVEDESMFAATPRGMMEENIEEVQGEPSQEQLEAIAFEIFRLPLEELNEQQLEVVYQAAMEQEPAEEEVQFAAQEGPGAGIASLV